VVAEKEGDEPDDVVVAVAHHDTVRDSPGANDNGSSIAVLLAAARLLSPCRLRRTIVLATTDMEEIGLFGARAFLADISERRRVHGAITLETIGYLSPEPGSQHIPPGFEIIYRRQSRLIRERQSRGDFVAVIYNRNASTLAHRYAAALAAATSDHVPVLLRAPAGLARGRVDAHLPFVKQLFRGDHAVFWAAGVPALQVTDTADLRYPHYHEPTDTPDRLDYDHLARLAVATAVTLAEAAT
jgi:Zn-dependent M28 family amino/carboxypeptidase